MTLNKFTSYSIEDALEDFEREHGKAIVAVFVSAEGTHRVWLSTNDIQTPEQYAWAQRQLSGAVVTTQKIEENAGRDV